MWGFADGPLNFYIIALFIIAPCSLKYDRSQAHQIPLSVYGWQCVYIYMYECAYGALLSVIPSTVITILYFRVSLSIFIILNKAPAT